MVLMGWKPALSYTRIVRRLKSATDNRKCRVENARCTKSNPAWMCHTLFQHSIYFKVHPYAAVNWVRASTMVAVKVSPPPWPASSMTWSRLLVQLWDSRQAVSSGPLTS